MIDAKDLTEEDYTAAKLAGKTESFMIEKGQVVKYQVTFEQWKANYGMRQKLHASVRKHLGENSIGWKK